MIYTYENVQVGTTTWMDIFVEMYNVSGVQAPHFKVRTHEIDQYGVASVYTGSGRVLSIYFLRPANLLSVYLSWCFDKNITSHWSKRWYQPISLVAC